MDFLTEAERKYISEFDAQRRAAALGRLSELATTMARAEELADAMREVDGRRAHKIGKTARQLTELLEALGIRETVEVEIPAETTQLEEVAIVDEPVAEPEPTKEGVQLHTVGVAWLVKTFGEDWRVRLRVQDTDNEEIIAHKAIALVPPRSQKDYDNHVSRVHLRIKGFNTAAVEEAVGVNSGALLQYERNLRLRAVQAFETQSDAAQTEVEQHTTAVEEARLLEPTVTFPVPRPPAVAHRVEKPAVEIKPELTSHQIAELLCERLGLDGTAEASLRSFLDPRSTGDMTAAKEHAVEAVADYLRPLLDGDRHTLTPEEVRWVRTCFGIVTINGTPTNRPAVPLKELRKTRSNEQSIRVDTALRVGLEKLLSEKTDARGDELRQSDFIQAALQPERYDAERFAELREELRDILANQFNPEAAHEILEALENGSTPHQRLDVRQETRDAFSKLRQAIMLRGKSTTGWVKIDHSLQKFLRAGHAPKLSSEPVDEEVRAQFERNVVAGIYAHMYDGAEGAVA